MIRKVFKGEKFWLGVVILLILGAGCLVTRNYKYVNRIGEPAVGVILEVSDTGIRINDNPKIRLKLKVYTMNRPPFIAEAKQVFSIVQIPRPGDQVYAKYDPNNPWNVIVLFRKDSEKIKDQLEYIKKYRMD